MLKLRQDDGIEPSPPENKRPLKMYVWEDVWTDYTSGMACALAHDVEEAREMIKIAKKDTALDSEIAEKVPEEVSSPKGFYVYGGS